MSGINGRTNEKQSEIKVLNEDGVPRNNRYSGSSVAMVRSGPRLLRTLKLILFNHSSLEKYQPVLSSVQIPGKLTRASQHEDTSIVSSITVNNSTLTEKKIISMGWKDFGDT